MTQEKAEKLLAEHQIHPAANLFPLMSGDELRELAKDIKERGLIQPIVEHEGAILDGRNRFLACHMAEVLPEFVQWETNGSPTGWVLSVNLKRRHLTASQKGMVATDSLPLFEAEGAERKKKLSGTRSNPGEKKEVVEIIPQPAEKARDKAAAAVGVNPRYVSDAKAIKEASPELAEKVRAGEISIPEAKRSIRPLISEPLSATQQKKVDDAGKDSEELWLLKDTWKRTNKSDRKAFKEWIK